MPLKISVHKSWHVYNKDNVEKVRQDEAKAKEEEDEKNRRLAEVERERRLALLRKNAAMKYGGTIPEQEIDKEKNNSKSIFEEMEKDAKKYSTTKNEEYEAEKKKEKEKLDDQFTMYLGCGPGRKKDERKPWYVCKEKPALNDRARKHARNDERTKDALDPLRAVKKSLPKARTPQTTQNSNKTSDSMEQGMTKVEILRKERLEREKREREKSNRLLEKNKPAVNPYRYNSMFNPELTQKLEERKGYYRNRRYNPY